MKLKKSTNILFLNALVDHLEYLLAPLPPSQWGEPFVLKPWQPLVQGSVGVDVSRPLFPPATQFTRIAILPEFNDRGYLQLVLATKHQSGATYEENHRVAIGTFHSGLKSAELLAKAMFAFLTESTMPDKKAIDAQLAQLEGK